MNGLVRMSVVGPTFSFEASYDEAALNSGLLMDGMTWRARTWEMGLPITSGLHVGDEVTITFPEFELRVVATVTEVHRDRVVMTDRKADEAVTPRRATKGLHAPSRGLPTNRSVRRSVGRDDAA